MIIATERIRELMKEPLNGDNIVQGVSLQDDHKLHVTGEGYEKNVKHVEGWESKNDFSVRQQVAKPATIQITQIILDNLNRWVNAQGTVKKVDFKDDKRNEAFTEVLNQVWHGQSYDTFVKTFQKDAIYTEFNGFVIVTKPKKLAGGWVEKEGIVMYSESDTLNPYMIFIAASDVYDYYLSGEKVEYIIYKQDNDDVYRLIDDEKDIVFKWDKAKETVNPLSEVKNELGYVPARKLSTINAKLLDNQVKTSPIGHIIPALDRYFSSDADLRMQFIRHNYPKLAIVMKDCPKCDGVGHFYDETETKLNCTVCGGSGKTVPIGRDGVIGLPQYLEQGHTAFPGTPATYITPDTESLRLGLEDLQKQREDIIYSGTGDKNLIAESLNTATENIINSRSLEDRISEITGMIEDFERFIKRAIKEMHNDFRSITDYSITVNYGRRITIKGETELNDEIKRAKDNAMPMSYIHGLQRDLIYSKYKNNESELARHLLLADVEPFAGYSVKELKEIEDALDDRDYALKVNFDSVLDEWEESNVLLEYEKSKPYKQRVNLIKKQLYEILQRRIRERDELRRKNMEQNQTDATNMGGMPPAGTPAPAEENRGTERTGTRV